MYYKIPRPRVTQTIFGVLQENKIETDLLSAVWAFSLLTPLTKRA